jgi:hypothetical protein
MSWHQRIDRSSIHHVFLGCAVQSLRVAWKRRFSHSAKSARHQAHSTSTLARTAWSIFAHPSGLTLMYLRLLRILLRSCFGMRATTSYPPTVKRHFQGFQDFQGCQHQQRGKSIVILLYARSVWRQSRLFQSSSRRTVCFPRTFACHRSPRFTRVAGSCRYPGTVSASSGTSFIPPCSYVAILDQTLLLASTLIAYWGCSCSLRCARNHVQTSAIGARSTLSR